MNTTTILSAYTAAYVTKCGILPRRERQYKTFRAALLTRIEAGDRAREMIGKIEALQKSTGPINYHGFWTDIHEIITGR